MGSYPCVYHRMSHRFRLMAVAKHDLVGHLAVVGRMNGDSPLVAHDPSPDAVTNALVFHCRSCGPKGLWRRVLWHERMIVLDCQTNRHAVSQFETVQQIDERRLYVSCAMLPASLVANDEAPTEAASFGATDQPQGEAEAIV
jgi:hypothetical protein